MFLEEKTEPVAVLRTVESYGWRGIIDHLIQSLAQGREFIARACPVSA